MKIIQCKMGHYCLNILSRVPSKPKRSHDYSTNPKVMSKDLQPSCTLGNVTDHDSTIEMEAITLQEGYGPLWTFLEVPTLEH